MPSSCAAPPRATPRHAPALWQAIRRGTLTVISSDHSGWSYDGPRGKRAAGEDAPFSAMPNGVPGLAARLPLLWSLGVAAGQHHAERLRAR